MIKEITLPKMGSSMEEGMIVSILVHAGQTVRKGDKIFEIETTKASLDMESPEDGVVDEVLVAQDDTVPVGAPVLRMRVAPDLPAGFTAVRLSRLGAAMESAVVAAYSKNEGEAIEAGEELAEIETDKAALAVEAPVNGILAAKIAETGEDIAVGAIIAVIADSPDISLTALQINNLIEYNRELAGNQSVAGKTACSGFSSLTAENIRASMTACEQGAAGETVPLSPAQKLTGDRMAFSKQNAPCFYLNTIVDAGAACELTDSSEAGITMDDILVKAAALACLDYPNMTGRISGEDILLAGEVNIALTSLAGEAILAPVVKDAANKSLAQIASERKALLEQAEAGRLSPSNLEGACMTITSLASLGVKLFVPIVVPGQASAIGAGSIREELVMKGRGVETAKKISLTISVDHKVINGAYAAQFLDRMHENIESPAKL